MGKSLAEKDKEYDLLEIQLGKTNYDLDQTNKTNENLISENKYMMEDIGSLKKVLKKIDDWKLKIFHLMREDKIEKEILRNIISDFPSYKEIKENFENFNKNNFNEISNINYLNKSTLEKDYLLSSFNNHNRGKFEEKYYNSSRNNIPEKEIQYYNSERNGNKEEKIFQEKSSQRRFMEEKVTYLIFIVI